MKCAKISLLLFCLSLLFSFSRLHAQEQYRLLHWDLEQGLSNSSVNCLLKDKMGFLWVGTPAGLDRFDGKIFLKFSGSDKKQGALAPVSVYGLTEDSANNIWVGTSAGIVRFDIAADSFSRFKPDDTSSSALTFIIPFWSTNEEVFCVESASRITAYNIRSLQKRIVVSHFDNDQGKDYLRYSFSVLDTLNQVIWMLNKGNLMAIPLGGGRQNDLPGNYFDAPGMRYDAVRKCIWLNSTSGLVQFNPATREFHAVPVKTNYEAYPGISLDSKQRIWFGTVQKGLLIYDPANQTVCPAFLASPEQRAASQDNMCVYCDRLGITWTGNWSQKGLFQINPLKSAVIRYSADTGANKIASNMINTLVNGPLNRLWISTSHGINIFDPVTGIFSPFDQKRRLGITRTFIDPLLFDSANDYFLFAAGPPMTLYQTNAMLSPAQEIPLQNMDGQPMTLNENNYLMQAMPFKRDAMVVAKSRGIFLREKGKGVAKEIIDFGKNLVTAVVLSPEGWIYLRVDGSPYNLSYQLVSNQWTKTPSLLDSLPWSAIFVNTTDHTLWVAEPGALTQFDSSFHRLKSLSNRDGLPNSGVSGILADKSGHIWLSEFNGGLSRLDPSSGKIYPLSLNDGISNQRFDWDNPHIAAPDGHLYFAGRQGLDQVMPARLSLYYPPSIVYLRSFRVNDQALFLPSGMDEKLAITLPYFQNSITIDPGAINYFSSNTRVRYKMKGLSDQWQYGLANERIRFDGLAPAEYTLTLQASNAADDFDGPEKTITISIVPPWWKTWWGYSLFALVLIAAIWAIIRSRSRRLKERNRMLEEKVLDRTKELKHSLEELSETQSQLVQREKMASLGELTAGIAHEIQNPLNFVNNFSEVNMELATELNEELARLPIDSAMKSPLEEIAQAMAKNEEKINHHGKRADAIVKNMLQHSRTSIGQKELTDFNALANEYLQLSYHGMRSKNNAFQAQLKTHFDPALDKVSIIPQDIGRMMLNLYNNAFYALAEKFAKVNISEVPLLTVSTRKINGQLEFCVRDNGTGIPQKIIEKVFQPFFTTKPTGQGTGLGLSLSFDIVKAHGGEIKVETEPGAFTQFTVTLPLSPR